MLSRVLRLQRRAVAMGGKLPFRMGSSNSGSPPKADVAPPNDRARKVAIGDRAARRRTPSLSLRHPGLAQTFELALAPSEGGGTVAEYVACAITRNREMRIEGESRPSRISRFFQSAEMRHRHREMEMNGWIVPIGLNRSSLPRYRLLIATEPSPLRSLASPSNQKRSNRVG
jgi:hypothetical protein